MIASIQLEGGIEVYSDFDYTWLDSARLLSARSRTPRHCACQNGEMRRIFSAVGRSQA